MYLSTPVAILISESDFVSVYIMLNFWYHMYAYQLLSFLNFISIKNILPITLQVRDANAQPEDQSELDII